MGSRGDVVDELAVDAAGLVRGNHGNNHGGACEGDVVNCVCGDLKGPSFYGGGRVGSHVGFLWVVGVSL